MLQALALPGFGASAARGVKLNLPIRSKLSRLIHLYVSLLE